MFPNLSSSSSVHSFIPKFPCLVSSSSSFIVSIILHSLFLPPFHLLQFLSNLPQYSLSYLLSNHPNNLFTINCPSSSLLLNISFSLSCCFISSMSCWYSFSYSSTASFVFSRFSLPSQVSNSTMNPFHCTRYLSFSYICHLFRIFSTSYSSSPLIMTGAGCSLLCLSTCPTYLCILLTFTTECILIVLGNSNSTTFVNTIFLIL